MADSSSHAPSTAESARDGDTTAADERVLETASPRQLLWRRLRRDRVAVACVITLTGIIVVAAAAPAITSAMGISPYDFHPEKISDNGGLPIGRLGGVDWPHILGVEPLTGRDLFARLLFGARTSLLIAFVATAVTVVLGTVVGLIAGYSGGRADALLGRVMDLTLAFPLLLVAIALSPVLDQRLTALGVPAGNPSRITGIIIVLSVFGWPYLARIIRGQVLSLREREYVLAALSMGARTSRILRKEVLPGLVGVMVIYATIVMPSYIAAEAALAYLGISVQPPTPTWGAMLDDSVTYFTVDPFYFFAPMLALVVSVLAFNLLGDAFRDALQGPGLDSASA